MFCTLSSGALHLCEVSELWSGHEYIVEMAMFNVQRAINPKVSKLELWFMCSAHRLMVLYIAVKFREKFLKRYQSYGADTKS